MRKNQRRMRGKVETQRNTADNQGTGKNSFRKPGKTNRYEDTADSSKITQKKDYYNANDPVWYMSNAYVQDRMADINWSNVAGLPLEMSMAPNNANNGLATLKDGSNKYHTSKMTQPGLLLFRYISAINPESGSGAINTEAQAIFTYVRKNNAAGTPYQSADLMLYLLALDSAYQFFAMVRRAWALTHDYSMFNRYKPKFLVDHLGFSYDDIVDNNNEYLTFINVMADKLNTLAIPAGCSYYARHVWMCSNVWMDEPGLMGTNYAYVPEGFYFYSHTTNFQGGELVYTPWLTRKSDPSYKDPVAQKHTLSELKAFWRTMFEPLFHDQDVAIMSGDILRAYGENIMKIGPTSADYSITPNFSQEVIDQMCNTRFVGSPVKEFDIYTDACNIKQSSGRIVYDPIFYMCSPISFENMRAFINSSKDAVTPADVLVDTRNIAMVQMTVGKWVPATSFPSGEGVTLYDDHFDIKKTAHTVHHIFSCGSEIFTYCEINAIGYDHVNDSFDLEFPETMVEAGPDMNRAFMMNTDVGFTPSEFFGCNYSPMTWYHDITNIQNNTSAFANYGWSGVPVFGSLHRYTCTSDQVMLRMNDAIMYSMFDIAKY